MRHQNPSMNANQTVEKSLRLTIRLAAAVPEPPSRQLVPSEQRGSRGGAVVAEAAKVARMP
jgi:hypothetical protein